MDYPWAEEFGKLARRRRIALSVHAPIAGFMGHVERDRKHGMATGMLDHSAGIAKVAGAEPVVFHPGFLLGRTRKQTVSSVVSQLGDFASGSRARTAGSRSASRSWAGSTTSAASTTSSGSRRGSAWVRPVIDFAHLHATSDGAFTTVKAFHDVLAAANRILPRGAPFHIHFSDIAYANRNETKHLPYGEGTLRVAPLGKALARFARPATVISEAPGEESHQAIRAELFAAAGKSSREALLDPLRFLVAPAIAQELSVRRGAPRARCSGSPFGDGGQRLRRRARRPPRRVPGRPNLSQRCRRRRA